MIALEEEGIDLVNEPPAPEFYDVAEQADPPTSRAPSNWPKGEVPAAPAERPAAAAAT